MIRKMTALLLALLLALSCVSALADSAYTAYTHPHRGYSFEYPSEYTVLDSETIGAITDALVNGEIDAFNFDFASVQSQIEAMDIVTIIDLASGDNFSFATLEMDFGIPLTADLLVSFVLPATVEQFKAIMPGCEFTDEGSVQTYGGNDFARLALTYEIGGRPLTMEQFFIYIDGVIYNVTYTYSAETSQAHIEKVLGSFKAAE